MVDYQKLYVHLFNAFTDAIEKLEKGYPVIAKDILMYAQQQTEEMYMDMDEDAEE